MNVTIDGKDYILLTQCPLLQTTEAMTFKTDLHSAIDGTETRLPLMDSVRQTFNYSLQSYMANVAGMFSEFYQGLRKDYLIPQPLESVTATSVDNDFILCDTSQISVRVGQFILVGQQALKITEIGRTTPTVDDGFKVHEPITDTSLVVQPLRWCFVDGDMTAAMNALLFNPQVVFRVYDAVEYTASAIDTYNNCVLLDGGYLDVAFTQQQTIVDGEIGNFYSFTDWDKARKRFNLRVLMKNAQEYIDFKKWFFRRRGRLNEFTLAMFEGGVAPVNRTYRLDSDSVEFNFKGNSIVECSLPVVEL